MTHMKTAFNFGNRLIVFSGRRTRKTRSDLMTPRSTWFESSRVLKKLTVRFWTLLVNISGSIVHALTCLISFFILIQASDRPVIVTFCFVFVFIEGGKWLTCKSIYIYKEFFGKCGGKELGLCLRPNWANLLNQFLTCFNRSDMLGHFVITINAYGPCSR